MSYGLRLWMILFLAPSAAFAAAKTANPTNTSTAQGSYQIPKNYGWSAILPSFVIHGTPLSQQAIRNMPRKMDDSGSVVITPGLAIQYESEKGFFALGGFVKDCYDNPAGIFQAGSSYNILKDSKLGFSFGLYTRQTPLECRQGFWGAHCEELDGYSLKWETTMGGSRVDIIPMPFVHFTTPIYRDRQVRVDFKVMSNVILNEFGVSIPL